jgi:alkylhydroperoxidase family enzyme
VASFRTSPHYDERERVALELAERMTLSAKSADDEVLARVRRHYSEAETVELAAIVAYENMRSRMNIALGVESQGFCILDPSPGSQGVSR